MTTKKILLIKSSSLAYSSALTCLKKKFPEAKISILATSDNKQLVETEEETDLIRLQSDTFDIKNISKDNFKLLKQKNYDLAVFLVNDLYKSNYSNLIQLAKRIGANKIIAFDSKLRTRSLTWPGQSVFFCKVILKKICIFLLDTITLLIALLFYIPVFIWRILINYNNHRA